MAARVSRIDRALGGWVEGELPPLGDHGCHPRRELGGRGGIGTYVDDIGIEPAVEPEPCHELVRHVHLEGFATGGTHHLVLRSRLQQRQGPVFELLTTYAKRLASARQHQHEGCGPRLLDVGLTDGGHRGVAHQGDVGQLAHDPAEPERPPSEGHRLHVPRRQRIAVGIDVLVRDDLRCPGARGGFVDHVPLSD